MRRGSRSAVLFALCLGALYAQPLPVANKPEDVGFSSERLARIERRLQQDVDKGEFPGAVVIVARKGKIAYYKAIGYRDPAAKAALEPGAIYRIASMTKPIVSVTAMSLVEEGRLDIDRAVGDYLPEFKDVQVGVEKTDPATGKKTLALEKPKRPMTVQDLMRHTSGLTYGIFGNSMVDQRYRTSGIFTASSLADMVSKVAHLPLLHQPGEVWEYSVSTDVLGRVVEVVGGAPLDQMIADRVTKPLGMPDTTFYLTDAQAPRIAKPVATATVRMSGDPTKKPVVLSGGGGLMSTAADYARFCQMLLNGGSLHGTRVLGRKTVELMTSDAVPPGATRGALAYALGATGPAPEFGMSFGLGFAVRTANGLNALPGSRGDFGWAGINGTYFWVDPKEDMFAVFMTQTSQAQTVPYWRLTRDLVYQALN